MTSTEAGRVVAVTGAARGIGLGIARRFARSGDRVVLLDVDASTAASATAASSEDHGRLTFARLDVRLPDAIERVVGDVEARVGPIDVWVNNAGIVRRGPAESLPVDDWRDSLDVMLSGAFYCSQTVGRRMLERRSGVVINIASVNGFYAIEGRVAYSVAKAGLIMLTQALGVEWADRGVRVVGIAPGVVGTEMVNQAISAGAASLEVYERRTPMRRLGQVDEVAEAAFFLASAQASYITAETLRVDGGWSAYQLF